MCCIVFEMGYVNWHESYIFTPDLVKSMPLKLHIIGAVNTQNDTSGLRMWKIQEGTVLWASHSFPACRSILFGGMFRSRLS
jgi:hypothetical protein